MVHPRSSDQHRPQKNKRASKTVGKPVKLMYSIPGRLPTRNQVGHHPEARHNEPERHQREARPHPGKQRPFGGIEYAWVWHF